MFDIGDLFQWERFITPSIIKVFYWLAVGLSILVGVSGILSGLSLMLLNPIGGLFTIRRMPTDILPEIDIPVVAVVWSYSGLPPE